MIKRNTQDWWNVTEKGKPKYPDKSLSQCYYVNYNVTGTGLASKAEMQAERPETKRSEPWHGLSANNTGLFEMIVGVLTTCHTQYT
jgi:hypothetical protein